MRFKSMIWFIYWRWTLYYPSRWSPKGLEYFNNKFRDLLDCTINGMIINEESRIPGYEGGKWERTLFGWLQVRTERDSFRNSNVNSTLKTVSTMPIGASDRPQAMCINAHNDSFCNKYHRAWI